LVERLSAGERQLVEIARALSSQPRLILFDEPTTSLSDRETRQFFALLERLRARGLTMIYISHTLGDVLRFSDQLAVLRDGALVAHGPREEFDLDRLVTLMVGRRLDRLFPVRQPVGETAVPSRAAESSDVAGQTVQAYGEPGVGPLAPANAPLLEVRGLTRSGVVHDISFKLHAGEVLGLFGLMGAGRSELARILFGLEPFEQGSIHVRGRPLASPQPIRCLREGVAFLTESRHEDGLALEASIADNLALVTLRRHARRGTGWLNRATLAQAVRGIRQAVRLTPTAHDTAPVRTLSGGNQQKVVLGKWLLAQPQVLILDEPTRGIDVGAKFEIYQLIVQRAEAGAGVLFISSELEELIGLCDRLLVMRRGELVEELRRAEFDRERILRAALHERSAP
jgi:ribose transport system ATP-binding protein